MPNKKAENIFSEEALKVLKISAKKLKVKLNGKMTIKKAIFILARPEGFAGRKGDGNPKITSIWRGCRSLMERLSFLDDMSYGFY